MPKVRTIAHGRIKPRPVKCPKHLARVAGLPCLACGAWPVEVHHVRGYADRAGQLARSDRLVTPLCADHHRDGFLAVHRLSHQGFYRVWTIDLLAEAKRLEAESVAMQILEEL